MARNHNYTISKNGENFTFELNSDGLRGDISSQGNTTIGDYRTIYANKYQVIEVEYYSELPGMWRASLVFVR